MTARINIEGLETDSRLAAFINEKALPGTGVDADVFWKGLSALIHDFGPRNRALLERRAELQREIDSCMAGTAPLMPLPMRPS